MKKVFLIHFSALAAGLLAATAQQDAPAASSGFPAVVTDLVSQKPRLVYITKVAGGQIYLNASGGTAAVPVASFSSVELDLPAAIKSAREAYRSGDVEKAASLFAALKPYREFVGLPKSNIASEFLDFADSYRQMRKYAQAETVLESLDFGNNAEALLRDRLIRAFILCDKKETAKAAELMKEFPRTAPEDFNFPLDRIVRTRLFLAEEKYHEAALEAAEAVASTRIEAPVYPEALYLAASCYEKMGEVVEASLAGRNRTDSEQIIDETIDYPAVGKAVRQELTLLFPKNYWARQKPVSVEELLTAASSVTLNQPAAGAADGAAPAEGTPESKKEEEKPNWNDFLNKTQKPTENDDH